MATMRCQVGAYGECRWYVVRQAAGRHNTLTTMPLISSRAATVSAYAYSRESHTRREGLA